MNETGPNGASMGDPLDESQGRASDYSALGKGRWFGPLALLGFFLLKAKAILGALSLANLSSLLFSFSTMFVSFGAYGLAYGWSFGAAFVILILVHELGHYILMKAADLDPGLPVFVPFLGAWVKMSKLPDNQGLNAWVALAGPLLGGIFAMAIVLLALFWQSNFLMAVGNVGCVLNLFQLLPVRPLDGGFIVPALGKWRLACGLLSLFFLALLWQMPLLCLLTLVGLYPLFLAFRNKTVRPFFMRPVGVVEGWFLTVGYFGTAWLLGFFFALSQGG